MSSITMKELLNIGCNLHVSATGVSAITLKELARIARSKNVHLTINGTKSTAIALKEVANIGRENVTIIV